MHSIYNSLLESPWPTFYLSLITELFWLSLTVEQWSLVSFSGTC